MDTNDNVKRTDFYFDCFPTIHICFLLFNNFSSISCLHEWEPHDGDPVTTLFFCDDLLISDDSSPFWRYLITGSAYNSVIKIWCAVKWECLQTIE